MKYFSLTILSFVTFFSFGQKSIYFSTPLPSAENSVLSVDQRYFGSYTSQEDLRTFVFDENGITVISTTVSSISKKIVRESSSYDVRNNFIFGVVKDDSLPCVLEDGRYYFGVRHSDQMIGSDADNILTKINNSQYVLNIYENGHFIPMKITFDGNECSFAYFDYEEDSNIFDYIENKETENSDYLEVIILAPNESEANKLLKKKIFSDGQTLKKT